MDAYESYRSAHAQLRQLLGRLGEWPAGSQEQLHALRGLAVLICAELEAYLRSVVHEALDSIADDWDALLPAQRRLMGNHILREMESVLSSLKTALRELVRLRNDAAHQEHLGLQPTPEQIRTFFKITATTVRGVRGYVANQPSGVDRRAV